MKIVVIGGTRADRHQSCQNSSRQESRGGGRFAFEGN